MKQLSFGSLTCYIQLVTSEITWEECVLQRLAQGNDLVHPDCHGLDVDPQM